MKLVTVAACDILCLAACEGSGHMNEQACYSRLPHTHPVHVLAHPLSL